MSRDFALMCWRLYRKQLLATPALMLAGAVVLAWRGGMTAVLPALGILGVMAPIFAGLSGAFGSHVLAAPWAECDEVLPLSARRRAASLLALVLAFIAVEIVGFYAIAILLVHGQLEAISSLLATAVSAGLTVVAALAFSGVLVVAGSLALFTFAGSLQRQPQQGGFGALVAYGGLQGVLLPLGMGLSWLWLHPGAGVRTAAPAVVVLAASYALPLVYIRRAVRLAWLEPGWRRRWLEASVAVAALACIVLAAFGFERSARARLHSWPELAAPYLGRLVEKDETLETDRSPLPGGTLVGFGDGRLYWVRADGGRALVKTVTPLTQLAGLVESRSEPQVSFFARGALWVLYSASPVEPQTLWTGVPGKRLRRVRGLPADPEVRAVFESRAGEVELLGRTPKGRWFRSPLGEDGDPLGWTATTLSVSTSAYASPTEQLLVGGVRASWKDEGSSMTLEVAGGKGASRRFLFSSGQLGTVGGGKPQPFALRYDGRFLWLVLAARTLAKAEVGADGARLVAQWPLPDAGFMRARGHRIFRPAEDGVYVNTRRGVELLDWEGRRRVLVAGGAQ